jgi:tRNA(Arg) A34 adenosine deaminase TadA
MDMVAVASHHGQMAVDETDLRFLERCVVLAERAVQSGNQPFGSVLVSASGEILMEDHNHEAAGDGTQHPELAIAQWAAANVPVSERAAMTVYTSGEHCPMCAAAHGWAGLGRIVHATSSDQLVQWLAELGVPPGPVAALPIRDVVPGAVVDGPVPELAERVRELHAHYHAGSSQ